MKEANRLTLKRILYGGNAMGFTLIELIITMAVTAIIGAAIVSNYMVQQRTATVNQQVNQMQQQLRGSIYLMEGDIRKAGFDPSKTGSFGVTNVQRWSIGTDATAATATASGSPSITVNFDTDSNGTVDNDETFIYRLFDDNGDNIIDLARIYYDDGAAAWKGGLVAEGFQAIGFAYAVDADNDGELDRTAGNNIIWAVDSDNDNVLDTNLDTDDNGVIDADDDSSGDGSITSADGAAGNIGTVPVTSIRAVRVWLLARTDIQDPDFDNPQTYVVGDRVLGPFNDGLRRRLLVRAIDCRNTAY